MNWLVTALIGNTTIGIVLGLLALLAMSLRRPALAHAIWLLVLLKLVTPPMVRVNGWAVSAPATAEQREPPATTVATAPAPIRPAPMAIARPSPARQGQVRAPSEPSDVVVTA